MQKQTNKQATQKVSKLEGKQSAMNNLEAMVEEEMRKRELAMQEKLKEKLKRQILIFNKEKANFTRKTQHEISKQRKCLELLDTEKMTELENYLSVCSRSTELLYKQREAVVRDLVQSTDVVKELLEKEREDSRDLDARIMALTKKTWDVKRATALMKNEQNKFPIVNPYRMDNRVEHSAGQFYKQLRKNKQIEAEINAALRLRDVFIKEEKKLENSLEDVYKSISSLMVEIGEVYESRDRAEQTKIKVKDHLTKVKDKYEREILTISLQLSEDKKMEAFMRTKHKDTTHALREARKKTIDEVDKMMRQKDEYTKCFEQISHRTGKRDISKIVEEFIDAEEDNFALFLNIGELIDDNEEMRLESNTLRDKNVTMEDEVLVMDRENKDKIEDVEKRLKDYRWKTDRCSQKVRENERTLQRYCDIIKNLFEFLQLNKSDLPHCFDAQGNILMPANVLDVMVDVEANVAMLLQDYTMVELSTRAIKTMEYKLDDDDMMVRVPSERILPLDHPNVKRIPLLNDKEELESLSSVRAMSSDEMRDVVVKTMLIESQEAQVEDHTPRRSASRSGSVPNKLTSH